jgi:hypothetical protein
MLQHGALPDSEIGSQPSAWIPTTAAEREAVREQVGRILSSAMFRNSKRFPAFIRYTVEHALASAESLKERTIGHDVFGREAGYDTAQDPVVRMTAAEVRKRLAQYYQLPEHATETVITYQSGSYVPEFFAPPSPVVADAPVAPDESQEPGYRRGGLRRAFILVNRWRCRDGADCDGHNTGETHGVARVGRLILGARRARVFASAAVHWRSFFRTLRR